MTNLNPNAISDDNPDLLNPSKGVPRWEANMEALRTLQAMETEGREATAAERRTLEGVTAHPVWCVGLGGKCHGPGQASVGKSGGCAFPVV